jgi:pyruvate formate lyase activating enzyme
MDKKALFYKKDKEDVICELCPHNCRIGEGKRGICGAREARGGVLYAVNFGGVTSASLDPIEKKPLFHFKPGSFILSVGSFGCNFKCGFCQNYSISQYEAKNERVTPEELISTALHSEDNTGIAFTYNEPLIGYEFLYEVCEKAKGSPLDLVLVTNGYVNSEPLEKLLPLINAVNIDLKAFTNKFYKEVCFGDLNTILQNIKAANSRCHVEITTLLVNGYNDSEEEVRSLAKWLSEVNPDIPLHFSRYYPTYKFDAEATPVERVISSREIAREYMHYVYVGNVVGVDNNTYCPKCGEKIVQRDNINIKVLTSSDKCPKCGYRINIVL